MSVSQMVLGAVICHLKSSSVGAFIWLSLDTGVVPVSGGVGKRRVPLLFSISLLSEGLRRVWSIMLLVCLYNVLCCDIVEFCWPKIHLSFL